VKEIPHLTLLDVRMLETPIMIVEQSRVEIIRMGENVHRMLECLRDIINSDEIDDTLVKKIFHREEVLDIMQKEISTFLVQILSREIPHNIVTEAHTQIRVADEYESVSDYLTTILKLDLRLRNQGVLISESKKTEILQLHEKVASYFALVDSAFIEQRPEILPKVRIEGNAITHHFREMRSNHLQRISKEEMDPLLSISYMDILNAYRKIKDHILNIAEALAGEK